tara:strand:+ start:307 stop:1512 length:1206 start_codon:yes stop_codon:yes gene_type:complete
MSRKHLFSDRVGRILPSATLEMTAKAAELKRLKKPVYNMSVGEPDFPTPENIQQAGIYAIKNGITKYTPGAGTHNLKSAIQKKLQRDNNLTYDLNEIVVSCGGKHSLYNACQVLFQAGDEVIIFKPYWVSFPDFVAVTGAKPVFVKTVKNKQFEPDFKDLKSKITDRTKGVIINSPSNPTGGVWSKDAIEKTLKICNSYNLWIFSDECYEQLTYNEPFQSLATLTKEREKIITFQSCSKTYAMTGWRIGYLAGEKSLVANIGKLQGQSTSCPNSIAQHAAIEALVGDQTGVAHMREVFHKRRDLIIGLIKKIPNVECLIPNGAFYVFPNFGFYIGSKQKNGETINNSKDLCLYLLSETGVVTVDGDSFGAPNYIRFSYATSEEIITKAMNLVTQAIKKLSF